MPLKDVILDGLSHAVNITVFFGKLISGEFFSLFIIYTQGLFLFP